LKKVRKKKQSAETMDPPARSAASKVSFTPQPTPTDAQREQMRLNQLRGLEEEQDVRRQYETLYGPNLSEPHVLPPRMDLRKTRTLHDPDLDEFDQDSRTAAEEEGLPRIAELSVRDAAIIQLDNQLTSVFNQMRTLKITADAPMTLPSTHPRTASLPHTKNRGDDPCLRVRSLYHLSDRANDPLLSINSLASKRVVLLWSKL